MHSIDHFTIESVIVKLYIQSQLVILSLLTDICSNDLLVHFIVRSTSFVKYLNLSCSAFWQVIPPPLSHRQTEFVEQQN